MARGADNYVFHGARRVKTLSVTGEIGVLRAFAIQTLTSGLVCITVLVRMAGMLHELSLELEKSDLVGLLSESSSADVQSILSDETSVGVSDTAVVSILTVFSWMGTLLVGHLLILARPFTY